MIRGSGQRLPEILQGSERARYCRRARFMGHAFSLPPPIPLSTSARP